MKVFLVVAPLALLLVAAAVSAGGSAPPPFEACCACVTRPPEGTVSQIAPDLEPALFCRRVMNSEQRNAFGETCTDHEGIGICIAEVGMAAASQDQLDCDALFAERGIVCPPAKPVPVAGPPLLAGLAALLAGLGILAAARRSTPR